MEVKLTPDPNMERFIYVKKDCISRNPDFMTVELEGYEGFIPFLEENTDPAFFRGFREGYIGIVFSSPFGSSVKEVYYKGNKVYPVEAYKPYNIIGPVAMDGNLSDCLRFPLSETLSLYVPRANADPEFCENFNGGHINIEWENPEEESGLVEIRHKGKTVYKPFYS